MYEDKDVDRMNVDLQIAEDLLWDVQNDDTNDEGIELDEEVFEGDEDDDVDDDVDNDKSAVEKMQVDRSKILFRTGCSW